MQNNTENLTPTIDRPKLVELLRDFIKQDPNFDIADYGGSLEAYNADYRTYADARTDAMQYLKKPADHPRVPLLEQLILLTDAEVIDAFRAFSGRLSMKFDKYGKLVGLEYCTGQYFHTEFCSAARAVLSAIHHAAKLALLQKSGRIRVPATHVISKDELVKLVKDNGSHWFDKDTLAFFKSKFERNSILVCKGGWMFVTSEQHGDDYPRLFTVRFCSEEGDIDTVGDFQEHASKASAMNAARQAAKESFQDTLRQ